MHCFAENHLWPGGTLLLVKHCVFLPKSLVLSYIVIVKTFLQNKYRRIHGWRCGCKFINAPKTHEKIRVLGKIKKKNNLLYNWGIR